MDNCILRKTACFIACLAIAYNLSARSIQIRSSYGGLWETKNAMVVDEVEGFTKMENARDAWNRYGSYKYLRADSTGYFHVQKIDGRWWLIDPDGYAGINRAVTSFAVPQAILWHLRVKQRMPTIRTTIVHGDIPVGIIFIKHTSQNGKITIRISPPHRVTMCLCWILSLKHSVWKQQKAISVRLLLSAT